MACASLVDALKVRPGGTQGLQNPEEEFDSLASCEGT